MNNLDVLDDPKALARLFVSHITALPSNASKLQVMSNIRRQVFEFHFVVTFEERFLEQTAVELFELTNRIPTINVKRIVLKS